MRTTAGSRAALLLIVCLTAAAPAAAAVVPLTEVENDAEIALAGDRVIVFETLETGVRVRAISMAGGPSVSLYEEAAGEDNELLIDGAASAERIAFTVLHQRGFEQEFLRQVRVGGLDGPFDVVASGEWGHTPVPTAEAVSGANVFLSDYGPDFSGPLRWSAFADGARRDVAVPAGSIAVDFAGDLAGAPVFEPRGRTRYVVVDHRTGQQRLAVRTFSPDTHALRADGTVALAKDRVVVVSPAAPEPRTIARDLGIWDFAGRHVVGVRSAGAGEGVRAVAVDGSGGHRVGPVTRAVHAVDGDDAGRVAYVANGCAVVASAADRPVKALPAGVCPRSEVTLDIPERGHVRRRGVPVRVFCLAAPETCRGTVQVAPGARSRRFTVPVGDTRDVRVPLGADARRKLRRAFRSGDGQALIKVRAVSIDPEGRETATRASLLVYRDARARRRG